MDDSNLKPDYVDLCSSEADFPVDASRSSPASGMQPLHLHAVPYFLLKTLISDNACTN